MGRGFLAVEAGKGKEAAVKREEQRRMLLRGGPPRGRLYFALREAEGALGGGYARHTIALDHWRALVRRSQTPGKHHQGKKGHPRMAMDCDISQGELSQAECRLFVIAERS